MGRQRISSEQRALNKEAAYQRKLDSNRSNHWRGRLNHMNDDEHSPEHPQPSGPSLSSIRQSAQRREVTREDSYLYHETTLMPCVPLKF